MNWPWIAALIGMVGYGVGAIIQSVSVRRRGGPTAMFQPLYMLGVLCDALAWIGALIALQKLPLFTVQALLAGSLAVTVVLGRIVLGTILERRDLVGITVAGVGLVIVAAFSGTQSVAHTPPTMVWGMIVGLVVLGLATLWVYQRGAPLLLAALSGLAFSGGALGGRALGITEVSFSILAKPMLWLMIAYALLAVFTFSRALERAPVGSVLAVMWVVDVIVPGVIGMLVLGDTVRGDNPIPAAIGVLISVAGAVILAGTAGDTGLRRTDSVPRGIS